MTEVDTLKEYIMNNLNCLICREILKQPITLNCCGRSYCYECLKAEKCPANCPDSTFSLSRMKSSVILMDLLAKVEITCDYCSEMILGEKYNQHLRESCSARWQCEVCEGYLAPTLYKKDHLIKCPNNPTFCKKCEMVLQNKNLDSHSNFECIERSVVCEHCNLSYIFKKKKEHELSCEIACQKCHNYFLRKDLQNHLEYECNSRCNHCYKKILNKEMETHLQETCQFFCHDCHKCVMFKDKETHKEVCKRRCQNCEHFIKVSQFDTHFCQCRYCQEVIDPKDTTHEEKCLRSCESCKKKLIKKELEEHLCECIFCHTSIIYKNRIGHKENCEFNCNHCNKKIKYVDREEHRKNECYKKCVFCSKRVLVVNLNEHLFSDCGETCRFCGEQLSFSEYMKHVCQRRNLTEEERTSFHLELMESINAFNQTMHNLNTNK